MGRLRILLVALLAAALLSATLGTAQAGAGDRDQVRERYRAYALLRERLRACSLDRTWHHLGTDARRRCRTLRKRYLLYAINRESGTFYFYCRPKRAKRCPAAPVGVRSPRLRPPANATIFR